MVLRTGDIKMNKLPVFIYSVRTKCYKIGINKAERRRGNPWLLPMKLEQDFSNKVTAEQSFE